MATQKKRVVFYVDEEVKTKLIKLAEKDHRSLSNWLENLTLTTIDKLEKENNVAPDAA